MSTQAVIWTTGSRVVLLPSLKLPRMKCSYWGSSDGGAREMTPYYEQDGIAIYHGDTLSTLAALDLVSLAAIVSDPPYSSGNLPESMKQKAPPRLRGWQWEDKVMETDQLSTLGFIWGITYLTPLGR